MDGTTVALLLYNRGQGEPMNCSIRGDLSLEDNILFVKKAKCLVFAPIVGFIKYGPP